MVMGCDPCSIGEYRWPEYLPLMSTRFYHVPGICGNRLALGNLISRLSILVFQESRRAVLGMPAFTRMSTAPGFSIISANIVWTSLRISWPTVTKHLRVLERAGLLQRRRSGRSHILTLEAGPIRQVDEWIATYRRFWEGSLDALADYLERGVSKSERPAASRSKDRQRKR